MSILLREIQQLKELTSRLAESMGGVYGDPFNELATVVAVADPKKLGRVKVEFQDGLVSDWIYVHGSNKGILSSQYIGSTCLIGKANGRSEDAFVLGFINKNNQLEFVGNPVQVPILDEQNRASSPPSNAGDQGLVCNKDNSGRIYIFKTEMYEDLVVCLRRNNQQESIEDKWSWKSLTNGKWVEKGVDPNSIEPITDYSEKVGLPICDASLEGEVHEFTEDRKFRSYSIVCRRVYDDKYSWMPLSTPPVVFRTTLPDCTEKIHGAEYVVDSGRDSELVLCLRYQGEMKWVHHRTRQPLQFEPSEPPPTRSEFLATKKPMEVLATPSPQSFIGGAGTDALSAFTQGISAINPQSPFNNLLPPELKLQINSADLVSDIARSVISKNGNVPIASALAVFSSAIQAGGVIDSNTSAILNNLGAAGEVIANGIKNNQLDAALTTVGQRALSQALYSLPIQERAAYAAYGVGGALGAIDMGVAMGLSQLPPKLSSRISPLLNVGRSLLSSQPVAINDIINSALGVGNNPLSSVANSIFSNYGAMPAGFASGISQLIGGGQFGSVAGVLGNFASLPGFPTIPGMGGIPQLATSGLQLLGLGTQFAGLLGPAGLGLSLFSTLTGIDPLGMLLGGIPGLGGLFGGGPDCPCDPIVCRKTSHGIDSDGTKLLHPCGSVIANSHSSYDPIGNPVENNKNSVAESMGKINTHIGEELCVGNPFDLTEYISKIKRMGEMANMFDSAKFADWPEMWSEMAYTFETIEKGFKRADNNITGIESVERKLIDVQHRFITKLLAGNGSFMSKTLLSIIDTSKAVQDLYLYVKKLDVTKRGGEVGVTPTQSLNIVFENIAKIALLNSATKAEAKFLTDNFTKPADAEWKKLQPGLDLLNLTNVVLGAIPKPTPINFNRCDTIFDKPRVLKDSLESKLNSPVPPQQSSLIEIQLPNQVVNPQRQLLQIAPTPAVSDSFFNPLEELENNFLGSEVSPTRDDSTTTDQLAIKDVLNQIKFTQEKTIDRIPDCD